MMDRISARLQREPSHRRILIKILSLCIEPVTFLGLQQKLHALPETGSAILPPEVLIKWLEDDGAIYQSKFQDNYCWVITSQGKKIIDQESPENKLSILFEEEPDRKPFYEKVLNNCVVDHSRAEIEDLIKSEPTIPGTQLFPTLILQRLERAGAIQWINQKWRTHPDIVENLNRDDETVNEIYDQERKNGRISRQ